LEFRLREAFHSELGELQLLLLPDLEKRLRLVNLLILEVQWMEHRS